MRQESVLSAAASSPWSSGGTTSSPANGTATPVSGGSTLGKKMDPNKFSVLSGGRVSPNAPHIWECIRLARDTPPDVATAALEDPTHPVWSQPRHPIWPSEPLLWIETKASLIVATRIPPRPDWIPETNYYWQKEDQTARVWRDGQVKWLFVFQPSSSPLPIVIPVEDEGCWPTKEQWESAI